MNKFALFFFLSFSFPALATTVSLEVSSGMGICQKQNGAMVCADPVEVWTPVDLVFSVGGWSCEETPDPAFTQGLKHGACWIRNIRHGDTRYTAAITLFRRAGESDFHLETQMWDLAASEPAFFGHNELTLQDLSTSGPFKIRGPRTPTSPSELLYPTVSIRNLRITSP
jgi:hypothetical protein